MLNRLDQLQRNQREIDLQFERDKDIYLKRIKTLEKACQENSDEIKIKKLEQENKEKKELLI